MFEFDWSHVEPPTEAEVTDTASAIEYLQHGRPIVEARDKALEGLATMPIHRAIAMVVTSLINAIEGYEAKLAREGKVATGEDVRSLLAAFGISILAAGEA